MTMHERMRIFEAVFPSDLETTAPTPAATPQLGSSSFGASFGGFQEAKAPADDEAAERVKWDRAWHTATTYLSLPRTSVTLAQALRQERLDEGRWIKAASREVAAAVEYLVSDQSPGHRRRAHDESADILHWYLQEVTEHYFKYQLSSLLRILRSTDSLQALQDLLKFLNVIQTIYLYPVQRCVGPCLSPSKKHRAARFQESYHAIVYASLSYPSLAAHLKSFMKRHSAAILGVEDRRDSGSKKPSAKDGPTSPLLDENHFAATLVSLDETGLGGAHAQRIFAEVMNELLTTHIRSTYARRWKAPTKCPERIEKWVEERFARFAARVIRCMSGDLPANRTRYRPVTPEDVASWQERAIAELGLLRAAELFDIVAAWERGGSLGGVQDLRRFTTTPAARAHVVGRFTADVAHRLLHPGLSTTAILRRYIAIIRAFTVLDPKGVLLDRVARPVRRYLRERDDTVRIVLGGLLADPADPPARAAAAAAAADPEALAELAPELAAAGPDAARPDDADAELDLADLAWVPDPVDAGPDFRRATGGRPGGGADVVGALTSLFDARDVFVTEFQHVLGERLLATLAHADLAPERRVLALLRARFGEAPLQACEVMLHDVVASRRLAEQVQRAQGLDGEGDVDFSAKILSRLFWPALRTETFRLPPAMAAIEARFAHGFEAQKASRRLSWLPALGSVLVGLQLEDRAVEELVHPWQASVIHAFQSDDNDGAAPVRKTAAQLADALAMDGELVDNALTFWVGKLVLQRHADDGAYTVLERLHDRGSPGAGAGEDDPAAIATAAATAEAAASAAAAETSALRSADAVLEEKMAVFWQFIQGLLTNQGPKPLPQIVMMLQFAVPGGFPFGKEELRGFLGRRVDEGKLEIVSGSYKMVRQ